MVLLLSLACTRTPVDAGPDSVDTGDPAPLVERFGAGDPISVRGYGYLPGAETSDIEWLDAAVLDDGLGVVVGAGGLAVVDLIDPAVPGGDPENTGLIFHDPDLRSFRVAAQGRTVVLATKLGPVQVWDLSTPLAPVRVAQASPRSGYTEDVAVDDGRVLVGWQENGAVLMDADTLAVQAVLPAERAVGVGLQGPLAVVTDGHDVVLWDVSGAPTELDRVDLGGVGQDVAFDGARVVVGLGGAGVASLRVRNDALVLDGMVQVPGAAFSVALDGDHAWVATWSHIGAVWLGPGGPALVGIQDPWSSAMAVAALDGVGVVADWNAAMVLELDRTQAGPALHAGGEVWIPTDHVDPVYVRVTNWGVHALEGTVAVDRGYSVTPDALQLSAGQTQVLALTLPAEGPQSAELTLTTNDVDQPERTLPVQVARTTLGAVHPDFTVQGVTLPSTELESFSLADAQGQVVFLSYFATF